MGNTVLYLLCYIKIYIFHLSVVSSLASEKGGRGGSS